VANDGAGEVGHGEAPWQVDFGEQNHKMWLEKKKKHGITWIPTANPKEHIWGWVKTLVPSEPQNSW